MWTDNGSALDILNAALRIREFVVGLTRAQFDTDLRTQSAVLHHIIILGEAVKRLAIPSMF